MANNNIIPVILCGGSGTRLWPLSRQSYPKQYLSPTNNSERSLFQDTLFRLEEIPKISNPIIICNEENRFITADQLRKINIKPRNIFLEPFRKNTCPAITLSVLEALKYEDDPFLIDSFPEGDISLILPKETLFLFRLLICILALFGTD